MSSTTVMKAKAKLIKEETQEGANTAARVGGLFEDIVDYLDSADIASSLDITPYVTTGTRIAKFKVNGEETTIFAPSNGGSGGGGGSSYDDTEIWDAVNELNSALDGVSALADSEKERLDGVIEDIDNNIKNKMQDAIDFASWIQGNFPEGDITYQSGWNEKTKEFLQVVGVWGQDETTYDVYTRWSQISQNYDGIMAAVTAVSQGDDLTTLLQAAITEGIQNGTITIDTETVYANKDAETVIEWLYSGMKNSTAADKTFNQLVSAAKSGDSSAISELRTYVGKLKNGEYATTASLESYVATADLGTSITGLYQTATAGSSNTNIFSQVKNDKNEIESLSAFISEATNNYSSATVGTKFGTWSSGLVTTTKLGSAVTSLIASHTDGDDINSAVIRLIANNMGNQIEITTDMLTLSDGDTLGGLIFTSNSIAFFNACYEMYEVSGKYLSPITGKPVDSGSASQAILYTETRLSYNNVSAQTCGLNGHFNPFELVYGNTMYDAYGVTISNSNNSVLAKLSSEGLTVGGNELSSSGLSLASGSQLEISGSGGNLQIYLSNSGLDIGNTTYADDEIVMQSAFTIGAATFSSNTLALSTNALTFGNFQIQNITIGNSTYLAISPNSSVNNGILFSTTGGLGVLVNGVFKKGIDMSDTGFTTIQDFCNATGSTTSAYTIKNGLLVVA